MSKKFRLEGTEVIGGHTITWRIDGPIYEILNEYSYDGDCHGHNEIEITDDPWFEVSIIIPTSRYLPACFCSPLHKCLGMSLCPEWGTLCAKHGVYTHRQGYLHSKRQETLLATHEEAMGHVTEGLEVLRKLASVRETRERTRAAMQEAHGILLKGLGYKEVTKQ